MKSCNDDCAGALQCKLFGIKDARRELTVK